ncbi:MAG: putative Purine-nucleoside phosphorylase [Parachlamydiales bacterium]|nr:putative Purine-nucleoside phosphorylase [Parachlamydiales bacterium]
MSIPKCKNKFSSQSLVEPERYYQYLRDQGMIKEQKIPMAVVMCFSPAMVEYAKSKYTLSKKDGFNIGELYSINETNERVGLFLCHGVGAPGAAINLEEMIVSGVQRIFIVGSAGSLQGRVNPGDLVLCEGALRDEGTSHHYVLEGDFSTPSAALMQKMTTYLDNQNIPHHKGLTWTIDTPYRETKEEVLTYQKMGVLTVEMEASACFSVAQFRNKEIGAIFVISDTMADLHWQPKFFSQEVANGLHRSFDAVVGLLASL